MPKGLGPRLDPTITDAYQMARERGLADLLDIPAQPTTPLELPSQLATYVPFRRHLLAEVKRNPAMAVGFPATLHATPLANFLSTEFRSNKVSVWPTHVLIGDLRYQTPGWVRRLILAEGRYDRRRPLTARTALAILDQMLDAEEALENALEVVNGSAVAG